MSESSVKTPVNEGSSYKSRNCRLDFFETEVVSRREIWMVVIANGSSGLPAWSLILTYPNSEREEGTTPRLALQPGRAPLIRNAREQA